MVNKPLISNTSPTDKTHTSQSTTPATDSQSVLAMLRQLAPDPDFSSLRHSICVGDAAAIIAEALNAKGHQLDVDKVRTLGYLHDVGRLIGPAREHTVNGYFSSKSRAFLRNIVTSASHIPIPAMIAAVSSARHPIQLTTK